MHTGKNEINLNETNFRISPRCLCCVCVLNHNTWTHSNRQMSLQFVCSAANLVLDWFYKWNLNLAAITISHRKCLGEQWTAFRIIENRWVKLRLHRWILIGTNNQKTTYVSHNYPKSCWISLGWQSYVKLFVCWKSCWSLLLFVLEMSWPFIVAVVINIWHQVWMLFEYLPFAINEKTVWDAAFNLILHVLWNIYSDICNSFLTWRKRGFLAPMNIQISFICQ